MLELVEAQSVSEPSYLERLADLPREERARILASYTPEELDRLARSWAARGRPDQQLPEGDWRVALYLGGRFSGKTRTGAELVRAEVETGRRVQIGLIGATADAVRDVMVEGPSGLVTISPPWFRATYESSRSLVRWPNGAVAHLFSAERPHLIRGHDLDWLWIDEAAHIRNMLETWDIAQFALRRSGCGGEAPRLIVTTTPPDRMVALEVHLWIKALIADEATVVIHSRSADNVYADAASLASLTRQYDSTRRGRRELFGLLDLDDVPGALWTRPIIERCRVAEPPALTRIVVAVDPSGSDRGDITGIIVAGVAADGQLYVLADASLQGSPEQWGGMTRRLVESFRAHIVVAEKNFGGQMVETTLRAMGVSVPVKLVRAVGDKFERAEPVAVLFEVPPPRAHIVRELPELERELCSWAPDSPMPSPGRLDAMVYALAELQRHGRGYQRTPDQIEEAMQQIADVAGSFFDGLGGIAALTGGQSAGRRPVLPGPIPLIPRSSFKAVDRWTTGGIDPLRHITYG
jgi:phage terminase large subunit-like protein